MSGPDELLARMRATQWLDAGERNPVTGPMRLIDPGLYERVCTALAASAALAARCGELQAAIDELVACKDLKEAITPFGAIDKHGADNWSLMKADYERRKPLAWAAAQALASQAEGEKG